jgi:hypothetical protein
MHGAQAQERRESVCQEISVGSIVRLESVVRILSIVRIRASSVVATARKPAARLRSNWTALMAHFPDDLAGGDELGAQGCEAGLEGEDLGSPGRVR